MARAESREVTRESILTLLEERRNWGRWGDDDQKGLVNLIDAQKRVEAARLIRSGRAVSLSRKIKKNADEECPHPAQHFMLVDEDFDPTVAVASDFYGMRYHGHSYTHIDALCHVWSTTHGMWGGRSPDAISSYGASWGDVTAWKDGIFTRGVLFDVPRHRGTEYVDRDSPVHGHELEDLVEKAGIDLRPGDAIALYSGRDRWEAASPDNQYANGPKGRPGIDASTLEFLRDNDIAVVLWDMLDATPNPYDLYLTVHHGIWAFGIALVDNVDLAPLVQACAEEDRDEFAVTMAPLVIPGGTGSPLNPIALF